MKQNESEQGNTLDYDLARRQPLKDKHKVKTWNTIEGILLAIIIIGFGFRYIQLPGAGFLILTGFLLLSLLYFMFGFANLNGIPPANILKKKVYKKYGAAELLTGVFGGWAISLALIGIMYKALYWEGAPLILLSGLGFLAAVAVFLLLWQPKKFLHKRLLTRCSLVGIMGLTQIVSVI